MAKQRICVIGNSHAAAFRAGLDLLPALKESADFDFFVAQSDLMRQVELQDTALVPISELTKRRMSLYSNGIEQIETQQYDSFLIVGLGFGIHSAGHSPFSVFSKYQIVGFEGLCDTTSPFLSRACFAALMESILQNSTALYLAHLLRNVTNKRIFLAPMPYPSENILTSQKPKFWKQAVENGAWLYSVSLYQNAAEQITNKAKCEILFQPNNTLTTCCFTQAKFSHNSMRLAAGVNEKYPPSEPYHMNALYGLEMLKYHQRLRDL